MKLIIREYLASLRERNELDAILPDLLSQMGLNVFSRPGRGTRQDGVDVGAVGSIDGGPETVYLFSIKPGDLTRKDWAGGEAQDLRPSLNDILDAYIPNRLPDEHRGKPIAICICVGGDIQEQVRSSVEGFIKQNKKPNVSFEQWNGDRLADLIQEHFLREDLLPKEARSLLRKSLAMIDDPDACYRYSAALIKSLSEVEGKKDAEQLTAIRQISLCLWILLSWSRADNRLEAAYRVSELALLHGWRITRHFADKKTKAAEAIHAAFRSIHDAYREITFGYLTQNILPHAQTRDGLGTAINGAHSLDVNLKLFDIAGRLGMAGVWSAWEASVSSHDPQLQQRRRSDLTQIASAINGLISNNNALLLPIKDDQAIDICIALLALAFEGNCSQGMDVWLYEIVGRSRFSYDTHGHYPCTLRGYAELLEHPKSGDTAYRADVTNSSVLYPLAAVWAALFGFDETYKMIANMKETRLQHCSFQLWYPDAASEAHFYTGDDGHGSTLAHTFVDRPKDEFLKIAFAECERSPHFKELSAVKIGLWPLILVACRHYRLPPPLDLLRGLRQNGTEQANANSSSPDSGDS